MEASEAGTIACTGHGAERDRDPALLLVESLIHALLSAGVITLDVAIDVVTAAIDVQREAALERGESRLSVSRRVRPLVAIENTLRTEKSLVGA
jgi:hypothetical protein